jgi:FkbM family methyltransferase
MIAKEYIKKITPPWIIDKWWRYRLRHFIAEIKSLNIEDMGIYGGIPWVKLVSGYKFYGLLPSEDERRLYKSICPYLKTIDERCFGVVTEIIDRYYAPRSLPGELAKSESQYAPLRDPLNDFNLPSDKKLEVASAFQLHPGEVIVDIGAFHGFGTLRMAEYIGATGRIVAFEANPDSRDILKLNISENGLENTIIIPKAASNYTKSAEKFHIDGVPTGNSLRSDVLRNLGMDNIIEIKVDVDSGDNVLKSLGISEVNHISITVNGGEPEALEGLRNTIGSSKNIRISMPGWYVRDDKRLDKILRPQLESLGFRNIKTGKLGRVIAWK